MSYTEIEGDISDVYNTANKQAPARVLTRLKTTHKAHPSPFGHWSASLKKKKKTPSINLKNPYMVGEKAQKERNPIIVWYVLHAISFQFSINFLGYLFSLNLKRVYIIFLLNCFLNLSNFIDFCFWYFCLFNVELHSFLTLFILFFLSFQFV
jgi:hypothetical protein